MKIPYRLSLAMLLCSLWAPAWALDLAELTSLLAQRKAGEARFTEERHVSGLDAPLRARGTLIFAAPDRFERRTLEPRAESMVVEGNTLSWRRGDRTRQMSLNTVPEVTALIEAVRGTLTGNAASLGRHFLVNVEGSRARWTLTLKPRDERLATQVLEIKITGMQADLRLVELWMSGGDRSLMSIDPLQAR